MDRANIRGAHTTRCMVGRLLLGCTWILDLDPFNQSLSVLPYPSTGLTASPSQDTRAGTFCGQHAHCRCSKEVVPMIVLIVTVLLQHRKENPDQNTVEISVYQIPGSSSLSLACIASCPSVAQPSNNPCPSELGTLATIGPDSMLLCYERGMFPGCGCGCDRRREEVKGQEDLQGR